MTPIRFRPYRYTPGVSILTAFVHLGPAPTTCLLLTVPVILPDGRWTWGELQRIGSLLAQEYIYTPRECIAAISAYGLCVARMLRTWEAERFAITARGKLSGMMIMRAEWRWDPATRAYVPNGAPLEDMAAAAAARERITGVPLSAERFNARSGLLDHLEAARNHLRDTPLTGEHAHCA